MVSVLRNYSCCSNAFSIAINVFNKELESCFVIKNKDFRISRTKTFSFCCALF